MTQQNDKDMFERTWHLPDLWWTTASPNDFEEWHTLLERGNASRWDVSGDWKKFPYIFLVNRPLTFGHSQLVMPIPINLRSTKESISFECASILIKWVINGFEEAFGKDKLHTEMKFRDLAKRTVSYGRYEKTIIMRVSADEDPKEVYKVHLVPYFESNAALCQERYCSIQKVSPDKRGGLIGWLGDRETEVDGWQTGNFELTKIARDIWRLPEIAISLRKK
ncbi:MAG: hypothetical protein HYY46_19415 [Deltaproteobacteria bacterium]|nr:hypothetical protein [Deltaproteobacteria bacterium]